ncbi:YjgN family protein [Phenylobacterium sp.]|uniref:YjgN family protein n=1 Tax=Phenylobacterium sp. TaxID=1871053 RepID=UPI00273661AF|nr:DUF898 family protein [Phenylobacterium sp.]MDP3660394.1 DUF898 family protein [Phenylobacterium sp.]
MSMTEGPAPVRGEAINLEQRAALSSFVGLSLKNGLLNLVTLTLYRFWGKTEVRRRVWSSTYLNGEPLEYTGRGKDLFMGFLITLAVFGAPFLLVSFTAQLLGPAVAALIILPLYLVIFFLFGFGMFSAFRYMASRTVWRGIRFEARGSARDYALSYIGYALLSVITAGWFWPAAQRRLAGLLWGSLSFGDRPLRFDIEAARKVAVYPAFILAGVGVGVMYAVIVGVVVLLSIGAKEAGASPDEISAITAVAIVVLMLIAAPLMVAAIAPYQAAKLRATAAGLRLDDAGFRFDLKWPAMAWLMFTNVLLLIVSLGFLMPLIQARTIKFLIGRLRSEGLADLAAARQAPQGPRTAEGLADAFGWAPI